MGVPLIPLSGWGKSLKHEQGLKGQAIVWDENVLGNSQIVTLWGHMGPLMPSDLL